jgi:hypothetical protein
MGIHMNTKLMAAAATAQFAPLAGATDFSTGISTEIHAVRQVREGHDTFRHLRRRGVLGDGIGLQRAIARGSL